MSETLPPASSPEDFQPMPDLAAVDLIATRTPDGGPFVVHIKRLALVDVLRANEGLPVPTGRKADDGATAAANVAAMEGTMANVAQLAIVRPAFSFGEPVAGTVFWGDLPWVDRSAIFEAASALAGLSALPPNVRSFRGSPVRERADG